VFINTLLFLIRKDHIFILRVGYSPFPFKGFSPTLTIGRTPVVLKRTYGMVVELSPVLGA
jgi:hypothetical protein